MTVETTELQSRWLNKLETARYLGISSATLDKRMADHTFTAYRMGPNSRLIRFDRYELDQVLAGNPVPRD